MNQTELNKIIKEHKLWLVSNGTEGKRADLKEADLREANLEGANLKEADLVGANLEGANLERANLNHCYVFPNTKILGNVLITEFYKQYSSYWIVKSWVEFDEAGLAMELYK